MLEQETSQQDHNFVAPDETQQIKNQETAESIARRSNTHRSEAATDRAKAAKLRKVFSNDVKPAMDAAEVQEKLAKENDEIAEAHEKAEEDFLTKP